jgi:hypothetical protein
LEEAAEKVVAGPERKSRRMSPEDKRRVAFHEVGHALVATYSKHADVVHKISIIPRGRAAFGYTLQLPDGDQYLMSQAELTDKIKGMLGGRAAEEVVFNEITTGAENDWSTRPHWRVPWYASTEWASPLACFIAGGRRILSFQSPKMVWFNVIAVNRQPGRPRRRCVQSWILHTRIRSRYWTSTAPSWIWLLTNCCSMKRWMHRLSRS